MSERTGSFNGFWTMLYAHGMGARGADHIVHFRSQRALCGAPVVSIGIRGYPAASSVLARCNTCVSISVAGLGNEERQAGAYA